MKTSLPAALQMIWDAAKQAGPQGSVPFNRAVSDMIGGQRSLQAFLSLTGGHFKTYIANTKAVTDAMESSKTAVLGWDTAQKNFNVILDQGKAVVHAVFIAIGTQLLPKLGDLLGIIMPVVQNFATWVTNAKPLSGFIDMVTQALQKVFGPAKNATSAMAPLTDTFDRAKGVIKAVGTFLSPLADAFDRASGSIKSIKNNMQPMLDTFDRAKSVMKSVKTEVNPLVPIFQALATAFNNVKNAAIAVWNFLVPIGNFIAKTLAPYFKQIGFIITTVLVAALILVGATILLVVGAVLLAIGIFTALVAAVLFASTWVHDKIKWLVDTVVGFFKWLWQQLIGGSIIPDIVNGIVKWFTKARDFIVALWTFVIHWIASEWQMLKDRAAQIWNGIWHLIETAIQNLSNGIRNRIIIIHAWLVHQWDVLVAKATAWGTNLINNFLSGLQSAWGAVTSWVNGALAGLRNLFPHSPVKEGPLKGYETWGYTFGMGIADGIRRSTPAVESAALLLASAMGGNYSGSYSLSGSSFGGGRYPTGGHTIVIMPPGPVRSAVYLDKKEVGYHIMDWAGTDVRRH